MDDECNGEKPLNVHFASRICRQLHPSVESWIQWGGCAIINLAACRKPYSFDIRLDTIMLCLLSVVRSNLSSVGDFYGSNNSRLQDLMIKKFFLKAPREFFFYYLHNYILS